MRKLNFLERNWRKPLAGIGVALFGLYAGSSLLTGHSIGSMYGIASQTATPTTVASISANMKQGYETLGWDASSNIDGYALYRDGTRVSTAGTGALSARFYVSGGQHTLRVDTIPSGTTATVATTTAPPPTSGSSRLGLDKVGTNLTGLSNLDKYSLVIVSADGAAQAKTLAARTLIYSNASGLESAYSEGLSYTTAKANGWLLAQGSNGKWVVDHTKAALNQAMADADVSYVKAEGLKGMFLDDSVPKDPYGVVTPAGWEQGMVSFVHLLHQELNANGLYLLTNANAYSDSTLGNGNDGTGDLNWAKMLVPDGIMEEDWAENRDGSRTLRLSGPNWNQLWDSWETVAKGVQDAGMDFVGLSYNANATYGYASLLLQDTGRSTFIHISDPGTDPWGAWAINLGAAIDPTGSNPRRFQNGTVSVNSTAGTATIG